MTTYYHWPVNEALQDLAHGITQAGPSTHAAPLVGGVLPNCDRQITARRL